jgi:hypothetical protein
MSNRDAAEKEAENTRRGSTGLRNNNEEGTSAVATTTSSATNDTRGAGREETTIMSMENDNTISLRQRVDAQLARPADHIEQRLMHRDWAARDRERGRDRQKEGDLAVYGEGFPRINLIDIHICSPLTPSEIQEWNNKRSHEHLQTRLQQFMQRKANAKRSHYAGAMKQILPPTEQHKINNNDPLRVFHMDCTPAVFSPLGNMGGEIDSLLAKAAQTKTMAAIRNNNSTGEQTWTVYDTLRAKKQHSSYRRIVAAALLKACALSFSALPQRVNTDGRRGRQERGRVEEERERE